MTRFKLPLLVAGAVLALLLATALPLLAVRADLAAELRGGFDAAARRKLRAEAGDDRRT